MLYMVLISLVSVSMQACNPCGGRNSPELNRDYYLPPSKITWKEGSQQPSYVTTSTEGELKENDLKTIAVTHMTKSFVYRGKGAERTEGICDGGKPYTRDLPKIRRSSPDSRTSAVQDLDKIQSTLCERFKLSLAGICTASRWIWVPSSTIPSPLRREQSFVAEQPGLAKTTEVIDTRKRSLRPTESKESVYPYKTTSGKDQMLSIPGNNKPYGAKKRYKQSRK